MNECPFMTTAAGAQVADNQNPQTAGPRRPVLMQDYRRITCAALFAPVGSTCDMFGRYSSVAADLGVGIGEIAG